MLMPPDTAGKLMPPDTAGMLMPPDTAGMLTPPDTAGMLMPPDVLGTLMPVFTAALVPCPDPSFPSNTLFLGHNICQMRMDTTWSLGQMRQTYPKISILAAPEAACRATTGDESAAFTKLSAKTYDIPDQ
jgi:hypothetical protein